MAHIANKALFILDADMSPGFNPGTSGGVAHVAGTQIFYFWNTGTTWDKVDIGAVSGADGNHTPITRGNSTEDVAPSAGEAPDPINGDSASVYLTSAKHEFWVYSGGWTKAYVLQADLASNLSNGSRTTTTYDIDNSNGTGVTLAAATTSLAGLLEAADKTKIDFISITQAVDLDELEAESANLVTLSGMPSDSVDLGVFSGSTISDNVTIKAALQALETAHETLETAVEANTNRRTLYADLVSTSNVTLSGEQTIDGVLTSTSVVLLVAQTDASENGLYTTAAGAWTRFADLDEADEFTIGRIVVILDGGTDSGNTVWINQDTVTTLETDNITFNCLSVCISGNQDNEFEIIKDSGGIRVERQTLTAYATHALADAALDVGEAYILTANNQEGIVSDGASGPVFRKT